MKPCSGTHMQPGHDTQDSNRTQRTERKIPGRTHRPPPPWTLRPHLPELAGPGWGCVTTRKSQLCHISPQTGLPPHSHGRSWQGRGGSSPQAEFRQVWKDTGPQPPFQSSSNMGTDGAKALEPIASAGISPSLSNSCSFQLFNIAALYICVCAQRELSPQ